MSSAYFVDPGTDLLLRSVRSSGTDIHPRNQLRNEIPSGCGRARADSRAFEGRKEYRGRRLTFEWYTLYGGAKGAEEAPRDRCMQSFSNSIVGGSRFISGRPISTTVALDFFAKPLRGGDMRKGWRGRRRGMEGEGGCRAVCINKKDARLFFYLRVVVAPARRRAERLAPACRRWNVRRNLSEISEPNFLARQTDRQTNGPGARVRANASDRLRYRRRLSGRTTRPDAVSIIHLPCCFAHRVLSVGIFDRTWRKSHMNN